MTVTSQKLNIIQCRREGTHRALHLEHIPSQYRSDQKHWTEEVQVWLQVIWQCWCGEAYIFLLHSAFHEILCKRQLKQVTYLIQFFAKRIDDAIGPCHVTWWALNWAIHQWQRGNIFKDLNNNTLWNGTPWVNIFPALSSIASCNAAHYCWLLMHFST